MSSYRPTDASRESAPLVYLGDKRGSGPLRGPVPLSRALQHVRASPERGHALVERAHTSLERVHTPS